MLAARFYAPEDLRIEQVAIPTPGPGELLVRTEIALTCGTDVKMYRRGHPRARPPRIIGHEFVGTVERIGRSVQGFHVGERVVAANSAPCGMCFHCRRREFGLCERLDDCLLGFTCDGAYAEHVVVPAPITRTNTFRVPRGITAETMALLEPLACVLHGMDVMPLRRGASVVVLGAGPIGLLHVIAARQAGAAPVISCDRHALKLTAARAAGAHHVVDITRDSPRERVRQLTDGRGPDAVIEAVGRPEAWAEAVQLVRRGGQVLFFGGCPPDTTVALDTKRVHYEELTLHGAFHHTPTSVRRAYRMLVRNQIPSSVLVTGHLPLRQAEAALRSMMAGKNLKVALTPS